MKIKWENSNGIETGRVGPWPCFRITGSEWGGERRCEVMCRLQVEDYVSCGFLETAEDAKEWAERRMRKWLDSHGDGAISWRTVTDEDTEDTSDDFLGGYAGGNRFAAIKETADKDCPWTVSFEMPPDGHTDQAFSALDKAKAAAERWLEAWMAEAKI